MEICCVVNLATNKHCCSLVVVVKGNKQKSQVYHTSTARSRFKDCAKTLASTKLNNMSYNYKHTGICKVKYEE